jgi:flagellar motility protein MotE (MotC chaperone)
MSPKLLLLASFALAADEPTLAARTPSPRPAHEATATPAEPATAPRLAGKPAAEAGKPAAETARPGTEIGKPAAAEPTKPTAIAAAENAATGCTCDPAELQLLRGLRARLVQLEERERALVEREAVLGQIEAELGGRLQAATREVEQLENRAGPALTAVRTRASTDPAALVSVNNALTTLPPKKASQILASTDPDTAARLLAALPPERSAAILASMDASAAAVLVQRMARKPAPVELATAPAAATAPSTTAKPHRAREKNR